MQAGLMRATSSQAAALRLGSLRVPGGWDAQSQFWLVWIRVFPASQALLSGSALIIRKGTAKEWLGMDGVWGM